MCILSKTAISLDSPLLHEGLSIIHNLSYLSASQLAVYYTKAHPQERMFIIMKDDPHKLITSVHLFKRYDIKLTKVGDKEVADVKA